MDARHARAGISDLVSGLAAAGLLAASLWTVPAGATEPVNINSATAEELAAAISGVGEAKAKAIVAYREQHGPFRSVQELTRVSGIGTQTVDEARERLRAD